MIFSMIADFYTFLDIVRFNSNDWDQAYEVLTCCLERGDLIKETRGPENIIYHNAGRIEPFNLIHGRMFMDQKEPPRKRTRIIRPNPEPVLEKRQDNECNNAES